MNNKLTYEDILDKIGTYYKDGNIYFKEETKENNIEYESRYVPQYSYIHNKYFKNYLEPVQPLVTFNNPIEYRNYLIKQIIDKAKIKQIKSTKIINYTTSINTNIYSDQNKLFDFSKR